MENKRTIAIILARMGSSRLPGKSLMKINGIPLLKRVYDRAKICKNVDKAIVATSDKEKDNSLAEYCIENGIPVFRGDENDVLKRFYDCALEEHEKNTLRAVVRVTGDAPFVDPELTDKMIDELIEKNYDYIHNRHLNGPPLGSHAEVISFDTLRKLNDGVLDLKEREHVTLHILKHENRNKFKIKLFDVPKNLRRQNYRLIADSEKDFVIISKIFQDLGNNPSLKDVVSYLDNNKKLLEINKDEILDFKEFLDK